MLMLHFLYLLSYFLTNVQQAKQNKKNISIFVKLSHLVSCWRKCISSAKKMMLETFFSTNKQEIKLESL